MIAVAKESFISCLTEGKEYQVFSIDGQYILIEEDSSRLVWNWVGIFLITRKLKKDSEKMKNNYNFI